MKKKLIISFDSYSWIKYTSGLILQNPKEFSVIILTKDDSTPIYHSNNLCKKAVYAQRAYDLRRIGKKIGLSELMNLQYDENKIDILTLTTQLCLKVLLDGVKEIYYSDKDLLNKLIASLNKNYNIQIYKFGVEDYNTEIKLSEKEYVIKKSLNKNLIGAPSLESILNFENTEKFLKI